MRKYFIALSALLFLATGVCLAFFQVVAESNATAPSQWKAISYTSTYGNGQTFYYLQYLPPGYMDSSNQQDYPVIISLVGLGWNTDGLGFFQDRLKEANLERTIRDGRNYPFVILTPHQPTQVKGRYNYTGQYEDGVFIKDDSLAWDPNVIDEVLERAKKELRIDENRLYLVGCSMGGAGVWEYLKVYGDKIAAAVPIAGYFSDYGPYTYNPHVNTQALAAQPVGFACNDKVKNTPIWAFHAMDDEFVPPIFTYKPIAAINSCIPTPDPKAKLTLFKDGGHLRIYPRIFEFKEGWSYETIQDPAKSGGVPVANYKPTKPFKNDIFAWLLSHRLDEKKTAYQDSASIARELP